MSEVMFRIRQQIPLTHRSRVEIIGWECIEICVSFSLGVKTRRLHDATKTRLEPNLNQLMGAKLYPDRLTDQVSEYESTHQRLTLDSLSASTLPRATAASTVFTQSRRSLLVLLYHTQLYFYPVRALPGENGCSSGPRPDNTGMGATWERYIGLLRG